MFKHLLVPLDGSRLAEAALPAAVHLAQQLQAALTLLHVIERQAPQAVHGERHLTRPDEASAYLDEIARRACPAGLQVARHVHTAAVADVAQSIVEHGRELRPDLIVMCTHGQGGLRDLVFGSIAQQVVARGAVPVLLIRPTAAGGPPPVAWNRLLVALDGAPEHERGLFVAAELASACNMAIHVTVTIPTPATLPGEQAATGLLLPGTMRAVLELSEQRAAEYLRRLAARLQAQGLAVTAEVSRGDPATAIVETAHQAGAGLIALATHGKAGMEAFWSGSVAAKVSSASRLPLLLAPIPASAGM
jgi:nucleotide-binding universal stress UspA family protein